MEETSWIKAKAHASLYPTQVETTLIQLTERWPANVVSLRDLVESFPLGEKALLHLFALSNICGARIVRTPELLLWLAQPEVSTRGRSRSEMTAKLDQLIDENIAVKNFRAL